MATTGDACPQISSNAMEEVPGLWSSLKSLLWYILPIAFPFLLYKHLGGSARPSYRQLRGKVVLITGASSGLGEALANAFYSSGCKIILAARRVEQLERVKDSLLKSRHACATYAPTVLHLDLTDLSSVPAQAAKALSIHGHIDILVNNAGISHRGGALHTTTQVDSHIMTVNYFGQVALTKAILPSMVSRRKGHIVAVSSVQGLIGIPYRSAYAASKHALQGFCDSLRAELSEHGIKVTVVSPGYIKTQLSLNALTPEGLPHGVMDKTTSEGYPPEEVAHKILHGVVSGSPELIISSLAPRAAILLRHVCPSLYFWIMEKRAKSIRQELSEQ